MKKRSGFISLAIAAAFLSGCSYLQKYFPDKERDYQYTTEIPLLNWPADLRKNQADVSAATAQAPNLDQPGTSANPDSKAQLAENTEASKGGTPASTAIASNEADDQNTLDSVEIVKYEDGESRLRLGAAFNKSWRVLSKALSRNTIEVTERNTEKGLFAVQYDPDEKKAKDEGLMDELRFLFHGISSNEKEYHLKLEEHDKKTDVLVLDDQNVPLLNNEPALRLLKTLGETIKADMAEKNK